MPGAIGAILLFSLIGPHLFAIGAFIGFGAWAISKR